MPFIIICKTKYSEVLKVNDEFQNNFSERLTKLRMAKGDSAREMSLALGQSEGYIGQIERKNNLPSMTVFSYICEFFRISPKDFFDYGVDSPETLGTLIEMLKKLNQKELESVIGIVDVIVKQKVQ